MRRGFGAVVAVWILICQACSGGPGNPTDGGGNPGGNEDAGQTDGGATAGTCGRVEGEQSKTFSSGNDFYLSVTSPGGQYLGGGSLSISGATISGVPTVSGNTFQLASVGAVCGLPGVTSVPTTGYSDSVTAQQGHGYVGVLPDGSTIRFYVKGLTQNASGNSVDIQYQYPSTVCPTGMQVSYLATSGCPLTLNGVTQKYIGQNNAMGCAFPFVGCAGSANVEAWGAGGSGGGICISFNGGSGGGGGGGGGYGKGSVALTPSQFYVVQVGRGGEPLGSGFSSCPSQAYAGGPGGGSSFGIEDGGVLLAANGGDGGTGGSASGGAGGAGGGSSAAINAAGASGSAGTSNNGQTLCGGAGSTGPGGAGGSGGGSSGGAGGPGGCTPGTAGIPGGGGAGGSQGGGAKNGASGQVTVSW